MQINREDLRRHYASLSDDELAEIDATDLTPAARECYEAEVRERNAAGSEGEEEAIAMAAAEAYAPEIGEGWVEHAAVACAFSAVPGSTAAEDAARAQDALLGANVPCELSVISADPEDDEGSRWDEYRVLVPEALNLKALAVIDKELFNPQMEADWRAHLASLPDEILRALTPEVICSGLLDRVERLTRAYNEEVERRGSE